MWIVWVVILLVILAFEARALLRGRVGDTLSAAVWWLRVRVWGRIVLFPLWAWLSWHFFLEPTSIGPQVPIWWDDWIIVGAFIVLALFRDYDDYRKTGNELLDRVE